MTFDAPRLIVPLWVVVVALAVVFQPPMTIETNGVVLLIVGLVAPAIWLIVLSRRRSELTARPSAPRSK